MLYFDCVYFSSLFHQTPAFHDVFAENMSYVRQRVLFVTFRVFHTHVYECICYAFFSSAAAASAAFFAAISLGKTFISNRSSLSAKSKVAGSLFTGMGLGGV